MNYQRSTAMNICRLFSIALPLFLCGCSSGLKLTSDWRQGEVIIDGNDSEWQSGLYYDQESDFVYGVRNDDEFVYVFLKTQNRATQMQIMGPGLTVWFDGEGGKNHSFGVRYPLGHQRMKQESSPEEGGEQTTNFVDQSSPEMEVLGEKDQDVQRFSIFGAPGIQVKIGRARGNLIYELRVPLKKNSEHPYAVGAASTKRIGLGFETAEFKRGEMKGGPRLNGSGGGEGGSFGGIPTEGGEHEGRGHGGGHRGGGSPENKENPKQMELWLSVQLAQTP